MFIGIIWWSEQNSSTKTEQKGGKKKEKERNKGDPLVCHIIAEQQTSSKNLENEKEQNQGKESQGTEEEFTVRTIHEERKAFFVYHLWTEKLKVQ